MKGGQGIFAVLSHECREGLARARIAGFQLCECFPIRFGRWSICLLREQGFEHLQSFGFSLECQRSHRSPVELRELLDDFLADAHPRSQKLVDALQPGCRVDGISMGCVIDKEIPPEVPDGCNGSSNGV